jgi:hypothetical protein
MLLWVLVVLLIMLGLKLVMRLL